MPPGSLALLMKTASAGNAASPSRTSVGVSNGMCGHTQCTASRAAPPPDRAMAAIRRTAGETGTDGSSPVGSVGFAGCTAWGSPGL